MAESVNVPIKNRLRKRLGSRFRGGELQIPVEVKSADGNAKSVKTLLKHPEKYHVDFAIKLADRNVGRVGAVLTIPLYMAFLLVGR